MRSNICNIVLMVFHVGNWAFLSCSTNEDFREGNTELKQYLDAKFDGLEHKMADLICTEVEKQLYRNQALISGAHHRVPDSALSASNTYNSRHDFGAQCSRLGVERPSGCLSSAWCADRTHSPWWIQVNLGNVYTIIGVATQGRETEYGDHQWVVAYNLAEYNSYYQVVYYTEAGASTPKVFGGNTDRTTIVRHTLRPPMKARKCRLYVRSYHDNPSLRWELYGYLSLC